MKTAEVDGAVKRIIADTFGFEEVSTDDKLVEDFNLDSLDLVELAMELEDVFGFNISDDSIEGMKTVGDVVEMVRKAITV